jgi:hypothetical protein
MTDVTDHRLALVISSLGDAHHQAVARLKAIRADIRDKRRERDLLTQELETLKQACRECRATLYNLHCLTDWPPQTLN